MGGGAGAVADALGCSKEEAKAFVTAYKEGFKGITAFKEKGSRFVRSRGYIIISKHTGLRLNWEDFSKWKKYADTPDYIAKYEYTSEQRKEFESAAAKWDRLALNVVTQGTGAEIIKLSGMLFFKWICENDLFGKVLLCNCIHDEWVIEFPEELKDIVVPELKRCMEKAAMVLCKSLPIPAKPEVGNHWIH